MSNDIQTPGSPADETVKDGGKKDEQKAEEEEDDGTEASSSHDSDR
jgi:hypothetical protein